MKLSVAVIFLLAVSVFSQSFWSMTPPTSIFRMSTGRLTVENIVVNGEAVGIDNCVMLTQVVQPGGSVPPTLAGDYDMPMHEWNDDGDVSGDTLGVAWAAFTIPTNVSPPENYSDYTCFVEIPFTLLGGSIQPSEAVTFVVTPYYSASGAPMIPLPTAQVVYAHPGMFDPAAPGTTCQAGGYFTVPYQGGLVMLKIERDDRDSYGGTVGVLYYALVHAVELFEYTAP